MAIPAMRHVNSMRRLRDADLPLRQGPFDLGHERRLRRPVGHDDRVYAAPRFTTLRCTQTAN